MAEIAPPVVVTAISNSDFEGFVAGTLFSQGWNVVFRALDASSLLTFMETDARVGKNTVLVYSSDLEGLTPQLLSLLHGRVRQAVGFKTNSDHDGEFANLHEVPHEPSGLLNIIRGSVRAPLVRSVETQTPRRLAHVIAIGSVAPGSGCTSLALNLAMELSALGKETLLLDADVRYPSIAALLAMHKLDDGARKIAPHFYVGEFSKTHSINFVEYLDGLLSRCEYAVVDIGSIEAISDSLTDRRWTASLVHWSCEQADDLFLVSKADLLGIHRLTSLVQEFGSITVHPRISFIANSTSKGRRARVHQDLFSAAVTNMKLKAINVLPYDPRVMSKADEERATLLEVDDRCALRKKIAEMALELTS